MKYVQFVLLYVLYHIAAFIDRMVVKSGIYRDQFESSLMRSITKNRIKRYRGFDSADDVYQAYADALPDLNPADLAEQIKTNIDSAQLRHLLKMATKKV
ncbi:hypothetical protein CL89_gp059 [Aeromonas phage PX29]|uniref:Uncharacterized protein n=1 Tax=Aeromonas phage PX29 TaxID=926067 RepID=E5DPZ2_9CAUD|nr:hypothetical protein CL89_gp059 [Aeromonas phage PX29]ADQ52778.1 conserved hypothetical protein [Aeromonas phage PX29]